MSMTTPPLELAVDVAHRAGALLVRYAAELRDGVDLGVSTKSSASDPVSEADRAAERLIAGGLLDARPDDGLLGEEGQASRPGTSGYRWVVDPLDGTVNFLYGRPTWCVSIACEDADGTVVGVVHAPQLGETWTATRGGGARRHETGHVLAVSEVTELGECLVATGFSYDPLVRADQGRAVADLVPRARDVRRDGSAALDLAWVAAGRADGYVEAGLNPWDWAAGRLLVTEAGGRVSTASWTLGGRSRAAVVAGGAAAHDHLLAWLEERP
ncbi:inositol monophosphatase family protein [Nitriliruptor alkaliphilus]|uniref:inositol monophosphatase family protein n=1 Tax=Nitriliruptor alkaliphilus TaxID=427918 RepID=UPI003CCC3469